MTPSLDNSLSIVQRSPAAQIDYKTFQDPDLHFVIRNRRVADAFRKVALAEAKLRKLRVGSKTENAEVEFWVFDLLDDEALRKSLGAEYTQSLRSALEDAIRDLSVGPDMIDGPKTSLDAVEDLIALRKFLANAAELARKKGRKSELLFHHVTD